MSTYASSTATTTVRRMNIAPLELDSMQAPATEIDKEFTSKSVSSSMKTVWLLAKNGPVSHALDFE